jgi:tRNA threonylcarbamoyladenosine biosynthesis protein TsaB
LNAVAIETATETVGVAVRNDDGVQAEFTLTGRRRHVESLTPALEHLLGQVGLSAADLGLVVVDVGPGLFTGLRVGVAAAKGLAQARRIGIIGLSSLAVLTRAAAENGHCGRVLSAVDARRGEVFAAAADLDDEGSPTEVLAPGLFSPPDLARVLEGLGGEPILAVGDGAQRYAEVFAAVPGVSVPDGGLAFPPPLTLLHMGLRLLDQGVAPVDPALVVPLYMREADAVSNFAQVTRA